MSLTGDSEWTAGPCPTGATPGGCCTDPGWTAQHQHHGRPHAVTPAINAAGETLAISEQLIALLAEKADIDHEHLQYLVATIVTALPLAAARRDHTLYIIPHTGAATEFILWAANKLYPLTQADDVSAQLEALAKQITDAGQATSDLTARVAAVEDILKTPSDSALTEDVTVVGTTVGNLTEGTLLAKGTTLTALVKSMVMKRIAATYNSPSLTLAAGGATSAECGTAVSAVLTPTFYQNDAGVLTGYSLAKNGSPVATVLEAYTEAITLSSTAITFAATATYGAGTIKNDNLGAPSPAGSIQAGTVSSSARTYQGYRRAFFGVAAVPATGAAIRALTQSVNSPSAGTNLVSTNASGACIVWCYPATIENPAKCTMLSSGFTFDITSLLVAQTRISVADASGGSPIDYKVYAYAPAAPFTAATFTLTL